MTGGSHEKQPRNISLLSTGVLAKARKAILEMAEAHPPLDRRESFIDLQISQ